MIGTDADWVSVAAGAAHSLAIKSDGTLWAWGWNFYGQLGGGSFRYQSTPTQIGTLITSYTVTPSSGPNGSVSPSTPQTVSYNSTTSFAVTPDTGYHIASVTGCNGVLSGNTYTTGPITSACTVTATFAIDTYTITATGGAGGTITPGTVTVNYGSNQTFTVTADTYYHIADVQVDSGSVLTPETEGTFQYTFTNITTNHQIAATFTLVNIAVSSPSNGQIWARKSKQTISWTYTGTLGKKEKVSIQLLKGGTLVKTISKGAKFGKEGSGSFSWKVPSKQTSGDDYQIRITNTVNSAYFDTSDGYFTIQ
jgi:hypothetical protein